MILAGLFYIVYTIFVIILLIKDFYNQIRGLNVMSMANKKKLCLTFLLVFIILILYFLFFLVLFLKGLENLNMVYAGGFDDVVVVGKKVNNGLLLKSSIFNQFLASENPNKYSYFSKIYVNKDYSKFRRLSHSSVNSLELLKSNYLHNTFLNSKVMGLTCLQINKFSSLLNEVVLKLEFVKLREAVLNNSIIITSDYIFNLKEYHPFLYNKIVSLVGKNFCDTYIQSGIENHYFLINYDIRDSIIKVYIFTSQPNIAGCVNFGDCSLISDIRFDGKEKGQNMRNTPLALNWKGDLNSFFLLVKELFFTINYNDITLEDCILKNLNLSKLNIKNLDETAKNNIADVIIKNGLIYIRDMWGICYKIDNGKLELLDCNCTNFKNNSKFKWKK